MKRSFLLFAFLLQFILGVAQNIISTELPTQNQLPTGEIYCIFQDSEGYMWYGTEGGGLCRDDGYTVKIFRADFNSPTLLESNSITCINEDKEQQIWFGTKRGAYILDKKSYQIKPLADEELKGWVIKTITASSDGTIWISSGEFIFHYNSESERLGKYTTDWNGDSKTIYNTYEDNNKTLWAIQWRGGLLRYDPFEDKFISYPWPFADNPTCILKDRTTPYYWIGTWGNGIVRFDPNEKDIDKMFVTQATTNIYKDVLKKRITSIAQDSTKHHIWVTTMDDLYAYEITPYDTLQTVNTSDFLSSEKKMLSNVICDRLGNLWVASYYPHSFIISFQSNKIVRHRMPVIKERLGFPAAPVDLVYDNGYYWIWQKRLRLCLYESENDDFSIYKNRKLGSFFEKSHDSEGVFAAMSDSIVLLIQHKENIISESRICTLSVEEHEKIRTLHDDSFGNLWIGTTYNLFRYNFKSQQLYKIIEKAGIINDITSTADGTIYLATETEGFWIVSSDGKNEKHNSNENYLTLTATSDQKIWIGTQQGNIYCYNPINNELETKTNECGLTGDIISDIQTDNHENIWILTDQKIIIYNTEKQTFDLIRSSDPSIGVNNFLSLYKDDEGKMHIGTTGGILVFPSFSQLNAPQKESSISLTSIKINGKSKTLNHEYEKIILQSNERNIELFFSIFDPLNANKIRYAFRYKGKDKYWNYLPEGQNSIYLTELSKGSHNLEIRATDKNGLWSNNNITILVERLPAWYETWWAYALYILIIATIIYFVIEKYIQYQKDKQRIQMEEQVAQMKYRFFTNVSHELRTPLTLIITPLETIIKKITDITIKQQLVSVSKNAQNLLELVNQLLDFRKVEMKGENLSLTKGDIVKFISFIYENFQLIAAEKKLHFSYHAALPSLYMFFDHDKLRKIINNLLSNAIKFTKENGSVSIKLLTEIRESGTFVVISVEDTGKGIPTKELPLIFERFHQVNTDGDSIGSGIGLHLVKEYTNLHQGEVNVKSILDKGSTFTVSIPTYLVPEKKNTEENIKNDEIPINQLADLAKKVLIVDDNTEFRTYLKNELAQFYTIYEAKDGKEGEKYAIEKDPDIIVTDLMMPEMDGIELCHHIKNNISTSHIPVILLTANDNIENEKRGYKEGADAYIAKPFHWDILLSRIQNLMEQKQQRQQTFKKEIEINPSNITISSLDEQLIKKALELIEKNISNSEYSIEDLSKDMGMSRVNLYRKIHSITDSTPSEFVKSIRLKRAAELLKQGQMTVVEVAYSVGFNTPSYFTKSFKKMFGTLPTQYNEENR